MLFFVHLRTVLPRLIEREGLLFLDFFHVLRKSAVFEEFLNLLEGLYVEHDPDLSAIVGYDVLPFDIDRHRSPQPLCLDLHIGVLEKREGERMPFTCRERRQGEVLGAQDL